MSKVIRTKNLAISRLSEVDKSEILKFYAENWGSITPELEYRYFRPLLNSWFRITSKNSSNDDFEHNQSAVKRTIGFLRLYNSNSIFTGGTSLEYVIGKAYRRRGYATQALLAFIDYLRRSAHFLSIGAEVDDNNEFSKKLLKGLGFIECESDPFMRHNYVLSLHADLELLEERFKTGDIVEVTVFNKFDDDFRRYFVNR